MTNKELPDQDKILFPELEETPQGLEHTVDFSDLGPLFAKEEPKEETISFEPEQIEEDSVVFEPGKPAEEDQSPVSFQPEEAVFQEAPAEEAPDLWAQEEEAAEKITQADEISEDMPVETIPEAEAAEEIAQADGISADAPVEETSEAESSEFIPEPEPIQESVPEEPAPVSSVDFSDLGPLFAPAPPVQPGQAAMVLKKLNEEMEQTPEETPAEDVFQESEAEEEIIREEIPEEEPAPVVPAEPAAEEAPQEVIPEIQEVPAEETAAEESKAEEFLPAEQPQEVSQLPAEEEPQEAAENKEPERKRSQRKGRPKRKKGEGFFGIPNLLVTVVWIAITVLIGVTLGRMAWVCAADVLAFGREDKPVTITVYEADTIEDITRKLHEGGLIRYPGLFKLYASLAVDEGEIHPGIWDLNTRYDYHALVNMMSPSSSREVIELMIPEGYSCRQIFALMEENKICTALDLGSYSAAGELDDYWFLEGVERGDMYCLEGYLFPDTYQFYKNDSPRNVLTKMLDNFENRFDEAMVEQIDSLNVHLADLMRRGGHGDQYIEEHRFTVRDVINVASLIEKETSSADEGYVIASVIYNRLFNWPDNVPYLNIDATIVYALGGKNKLTPEDLKVNSPYNTYTHTGLTPGPIANPGLSSIRAALTPSDSDYYYYVLDPALGSHRFSTTYDEHKANIASIGD